jgi:hypothetical protein
VVLDSNMGSARYLPAWKSTSLNNFLDESHDSQIDPSEAQMPLSDESIRELGIEVLDSNTGSARYLPAWKSSSLNNFQDESHESDMKEFTEAQMPDLTQLIEHSSNAPMHIPGQDLEGYFYGQSTMELGI